MRGSVPVPRLRRAVRLRYRTDPRGEWRADDAVVRGQVPEDRGQRTENRGAAPMKERLVAVASALRSLHRALAERARRDYEAQRRSLVTPGEWLQRLTGDTQFAWLRSLSELMVDVDVFLEADPAPADDDAAAI